MKFCVFDIKFHRIPQSSMNEDLKILLLEDSEDDAELIQSKIRQAGIKFTSLVVDTKVDYIRAINEFDPDLILSDHSLLQFNSSEALKIYKQHLKTTKRSQPFILVTGAVSEEFAVQCIKDGADDYILKDRLQRLPIAIKKTLEKCRIENENQRATAEKLLLLERYEHLTQATSQAMWDWDIEKNTTYCGKGFEKIFGHYCAPLNDNNLNTAYISADDIERVLNSIEKALEGKDDNWCNEYKYLKANGEYAFVSDCALIIRNSEGKAIRMIGAIQDITIKKNEDLRLKLLESVITNTTDGIVIIELNQPGLISPGIVYTNEAFTAITGFDSDEIIGKPASFLNFGSDNSITNLLRSSSQKNEPYHVELKSHNRNEEEFWLNLSVVPIADDKGCCTHWVFILRDITEQRNHIQAIQEQNIQLKEISWMQSHVIRAPLARMMGFINLINSNREEKIEGHDLLPYVLASALELDGIIRSIVEKSEKINKQ